MSIKIKHKGKHIDEVCLVGFEERIGMKLPNDFRKFLKKNNGGIPETNEFDIPELHTESGVNEFLSIEKIEYIKSEFSNRFASNALPIAYAEGGNYLCLLIGQNAGIYFWDHELEQNEGQHNMFLLAKNFASFLSSLKKFDISKIKLKPNQVQNVWVNPDFEPDFD